MTQPIEHILDASAVIAVLRDEPGAELVQLRMLSADILAINLAEVYQHLYRRGQSANAAKEIVQELKIPVTMPDAELALEAGFIDARLTKKGLSLADRFCLAEARRRGVPAVTTDRDWLDIAGDIGVEIELARLA